MEHSDIDLQLLRRLVRTKVSLGYPAYPHPTHPQNRKEQIHRKGRGKKKKKRYSGIATLVRASAARMGQSKAQIQRPEFTVEGRFSSAGLMITANTGV